MSKFDPTPFIIEKNGFFIRSSDLVMQTFGNQTKSLPISLRLLLESTIRSEEKGLSEKGATENFVRGFINNDKSANAVWLPSRILLQDYTGVPVIADLAAMRNAANDAGIDSNLVNPVSQVDLVIDHSIQVDFFGSIGSKEKNEHIEMERNRRRYRLCKWSGKSLSNFNIFPPGTGICHQVNLEKIATIAREEIINEKSFLYADTLVGTDSHTTMVNALTVLGWGVGGIEAEMAMLGLPLLMNIPETVGVRLKGNMPSGVVATDVVLRVTEELRKFGVVGKFVEFFGEGLSSLTLADRATISNMAPEYGATCGLFPVDDKTFEYMHLTNRDSQTIKKAEIYAEAAGIMRNDNGFSFSFEIDIDLNTIEPSIAGPKRPQDRISIENVPRSFIESFPDKFAKIHKESETIVQDGDIVIAAITSCTNTSNPFAIIGAGLLIKKAMEKGLRPRKITKTSLAPGSKSVAAYLEKSGLLSYMIEAGFGIVGYGCTTCIGNSGPLSEEANKGMNEDVVAVAILSGNRNFEGRIHPKVKAAYLASPLLVAAYAFAGNIKVNLNKDPIGQGKNGPVYFSDICPNDTEINDLIKKCVTSDSFRYAYNEKENLGSKDWQNMDVDNSLLFPWDENCEYIKKPPFFNKDIFKPISQIKNSRILALLGDDVTTDHISPAGNISPDSPAGQYLINHGVSIKDFNSYGSRRGNHNVMVRGTFANIRLKNEIVDGKSGGYTKIFPDGSIVSIFEAAEKYKERGENSVVFAGKNYGTGSSRDWAAKGSALLGIKAVIAESFERIHRSNLIGMGILPFEFCDGLNRKSLNIVGSDIVDISWSEITPGFKASCTIKRKDGNKDTFAIKAAVSTSFEVDMLNSGGMLIMALKALADHSRK